MEKASMQALDIAWQTIAECSKLDGTRLHSASERLKQGLIHRYTEPHRYYHNLEHIEDMLIKYSKIHDQCLKRSEHDKIAMLLAIIFHDVVYDPARDDNEKKSGQFMLTTFAHLELDIPLEALNLACKLIEDTKAINLFNALDWSILGSEPKRYQKYQKAIRLEYQFVANDIYIPERIKVMTSLYSLVQKNGFLDVLPDCSQDQALRNIEAELGQLSMGVFA
jgi:predicted metal-dependent HD superfamily phosphohydrolase